MLGNALRTSDSVPVHESGVGPRTSVHSALCALAEAEPVRQLGPTQLLARSGVRVGALTYIKHDLFTSPTSDSMIAALCGLWPVCSGRAGLLFAKGIHMPRCAQAFYLTRIQLMHSRHAQCLYHCICALYHRQAPLSIYTPGSGAKVPVLNRSAPSLKVRWWGNPCPEPRELAARSFRPMREPSPVLVDMLRHIMIVPVFLFHLFLSPCMRPAISLDT